MKTEEDNDWTEQLQAIKEADKREAALYTLPPGALLSYFVTHLLTHLFTYLIVYRAQKSIRSVASIA